MSSHVNDLVIVPYESQATLGAEERSNWWDITQWILEKKKKNNWQTNSKSEKKTYRSLTCVFWCSFSSALVPNLSSQIWTCKYFGVVNPIWKWKKNEKFRLIFNSKKEKENKLFLSHPGHPLTWQISHKIQFLTSLEVSTEAFITNFTTVRLHITVGGHVSFQMRRSIEYFLTFVALMDLLLRHGCSLGFRWWFVRTFAWRRFCWLFRCFFNATSSWTQFGRNGCSTVCIGCWRNLTVIQHCFVGI